MSTGANPTSYDWELIRSAATDLEGQLTLFKNEIGTIYDTVTAMNGAWTGPSYDAFSKFCTDYKTNTIDPIVNTIDGYVKALRTIADSAQSTSAANAGLFGGGQ